MNLEVIPAPCDSVGRSEVVFVGMEGDAFFKTTPYISLFFNCEGFKLLSSDDSGNVLAVMTGRGLPKVADGLANGLDMERVRYAVLIMDSAAFGLFDSSGVFLSTTALFSKDVGFGEITGFGEMAGFGRMIGGVLGLLGSGRLANWLTADVGCLENAKGIVDGLFSLGGFFPSGVEAAPLFTSPPRARFASFVSAFVSTDQEVEGAIFGSDDETLSSTIGLDAFPLRANASELPVGSSNIST